MSNYCPISVYERHPEGEIICPKCENAVVRLAAWIEGLDPETRKLRSQGAWFANDSLFWAAEALIASRH